MPRKKRRCVYQVTRKAPKGAQDWSLRSVVFRAMKELKKADEAKLLGYLIEQDGFKNLQARNITLQNDPQKFVYQQLWRLVQEGVLEEFPDRRYYGVRGRGF
jgi:hypothetical protein